MQIHIRSLLLCLCMAFCLAGTSLRAASDEHDANPGSPPAKKPPASADGRLNSTFAQALAALKAKDFEQARLLFESAAESADIGKNPMGWLAAEFNACHTLCLQGRKTEADTLAKKIAALCEATLGNEDPLTSEALAHLAFVLRQHGHLADAEPVYRRNVQMLESKYGQTHYLVAKALSKHAALLQHLGKLTEAEPLQRRALAIMQKAGREDHPDFCYFLTNLASCLQASQKTEEAGQLMERAFAIVETTSDSDLSSAGHILREQAEFYLDRHQLDRAENLSHRALLRLTKRPDTNRARFFYHDMVATVYRSVLQAQGLGGSEIDSRLHKVEEEAVVAKTTTASTGP